MARTFSKYPQPYYAERAKEVDDINMTAKVENCATTEDGILVTYVDGNKILMPIKSGGDSIVVDVSEDNKHIIIKINNPAPTYTASFNANGGTGEMADVTDVAAGEYTLPSNGFTAPEGKKFKGWATSATGDVIATATYNVTENVTFYAIWEDNTVAD